MEFKGKFNFLLGAVMNFSSAGHIPFTTGSEMSTQCVQLCNVVVLNFNTFTFEYHLKTVSLTAQPELLKFKSGDPACSSSTEHWHSY